MLATSNASARTSALNSMLEATGTNGSSELTKRMFSGKPAKRETSSPRKSKVPRNLTRSPEFSVAVTSEAHGDTELSGNMARWFLNTSSLSRRSEQGLHDLSSGNRFKVIMNGDHVMGTLFDMITTAHAGDFIHGTAWQFDPNIVIGQRGPHVNVTITSALRAAQRRGVDVKLLLSYPSDFSAPLMACSKFNDAEICKTRVCCAPDARHPAPRHGSNHAKAWTFLKDGQVSAFLGSMDPVSNRWDTAAHDPCHPRKGEGPNKPVSSRDKSLLSWHGEMFLVQVHVPLRAV